ncbi:MAG TPA: HAD family hydrolase, partial [Chitinophagaceae bacterium]|nr:HAD family hydrolase [Chitinophagaceae bacterium]
MNLTVNDAAFFVFDLDDTLYDEIDFLKSAYNNISRVLMPYTGINIYEEMLARYHNNENVFYWVVNNYKKAANFLSIHWLLAQYREHEPDITLRTDADKFLTMAKSYHIPAGLITDGRGSTQRNKLKALKIDSYFKDIIISEEFGSAKPDKRNYLFFNLKYPGKTFYFFGDNTEKDFETPNNLGWITYCIKDRGHNIHKQVIKTGGYAPHYFAGSF